MQIAGYTLGRLLAQGVSGETYFAEDLRGQRVVLKLVAEPLSATVGFRERFRRDSDRLASFEHAHIVGIREVGEVDGRLFVVSDRVECTDLAALLARDGPLMTERALQIAEQAASALHAARWGRGVVHGNLKPTNILVDDGDAVDHVWLTDFGLWTVVDSRAREAAERGPATDTEYRAPELLAGEEPTTLSDQYALGSILHECLMGARPGSQRAPLPAGLGEAIARARAASPEERYSTAPEFIAAARRPPARSPEPAGLLQRSDLWERPRVAADPVPPDSRPTAGREPAASTGMARHRRRWHLLAVGVMLALAALAAAVAVLTRSSAPSEPEVRTLSLGRPAPPAGDERASPRERAETSVQLAPGSLARIDPQSSQLTPIDAGLGDVKLTVAVGEGTVWAFERDGPSTVAQIDPETNALVRTVEIVGRPRDVAIADGSVWVASSVRGDGVLVEIAAATGRLQRTIDLGYSGVMAIAVGAGSVWIAAAGAQGNLALRIGPNDRRGNRCDRDDESTVGHRRGRRRRLARWWTYRGAAAEARHGLAGRPVHRRRGCIPYAPGPREFSAGDAGRGRRLGCRRPRVSDRPGHEPDR